MKALNLKYTITPQMETRLYYGVLLLLPFAMALVGTSWLFIDNSGVDVWLAQGMIQEWSNPDVYQTQYKTGRSIFYSFMYALYKGFGPVYGQAVATLTLFTILVLCMHAFLRMLLKPVAAFLGCVALVFFSPIHGFAGGGITYHSLPGSALCALALWLTAFALMHKQKRAWLVLAGFSWGVLLGTDQVHLFFMPVALGLVYFLYRRGKTIFPLWQVLILGCVGGLLAVLLTGLLSLSAGRNFFDFLKLIGVGQANQILGSWCASLYDGVGIWIFLPRWHALRNTMLVLFGIAMFFVVSRLRRKGGEDKTTLFFSTQYLYIVLFFLIYATYDIYYAGCVMAHQMWQAQFLYIPIVLMLAWVLHKVAPEVDTKNSNSMVLLSMGALLFIGGSFYNTGNSKLFYKLIIIFLLLIVILSAKFNLKKYIPVLIAIIFVGYFSMKTNYSFWHYKSTTRYLTNQLIQQITVDLKGRIALVPDERNSMYKVYSWYPVRSPRREGWLFFKNTGHRLGQYIIGRMSTLSAAFNGSVLTDLFSRNRKFEIPPKARLRQVIEEKGVVVLFTVDNTHVTTFKNLFTQLGYPPKIETRTYGKDLLEEPMQAHILRFAY